MNIRERFVGNSNRSSVKFKKTVNHNPLHQTSQSTYDYSIEEDTYHHVSREGNVAFSLETRKHEKG